MLDRYNRNIEYMRISVTDRCNLRCKYCMPQGVQFVPMADILTYEEITRIVKVATYLGIKHYRLTGGEPLVRRGISKLANMIRNVSGVESLQLTTNGILLPEYAHSLKSAGITGINVSLDTINPDEYEKITGYDGLKAVFDGIDKAMSVGLQVKLNAVEGLTEDIESLVKYAQDKKIILRFIEIMPIGYGKEFVNAESFFSKIEKLYGQGIILEDKNSFGIGPARYYHYKNLSQPIGFIQAMNRRFCNECNRVRLTSQGQLKPCLCYDIGVDIRELIRNGADDEEITMRMKEAIFNKPLEHCFQNQDMITEEKSMVKIGG